MLHFFRKIRQDLLANSQFFKYLKYAIGEIILVVLGILIALQINNWNEFRNMSKKELSLLANLRNDINSDISAFKWGDSSYAKYEVELEMAIKLFYKAKTIKDIYRVDTLTHLQLEEVIINHYTYDEMVNLGIGYSMKNQKLQKSIADYYLTAENIRTYINQVNNEAIKMYNSPGIHPYKLLTSQIKNPQIELKLIDTSWIGNPISPTFMSVFQTLKFCQSKNNIYRRSVYQHLIKSAESLKAAITDELEIRNK